MKSLKNFTRQEAPRRTRNVVIVACLLLFLCILSLLKARYCPSTAPNVESHMSMKLEVDNSAPKDDEDEDSNGEFTEIDKPMCYESSRRSDTCDVQGRIRVQTSNYTIFVYPSSAEQEQRIRPYPRKGDPIALANVKEWLLMPSDDRNQLPRCNKRHKVPAVIFSNAGFTGNLFHDFTDVLIPLFITSREFRGEVRFIVTDYKQWWVDKYIDIFKKLSNYDIIDTENEDEDYVHCFPRVIVGPIFHKELGVNSTEAKNGISILDFKKLLRNSYNLQRDTTTPLNDHNIYIRRPRLLILSRKNSRAFTNLRGMVSMAMSIGFEVRIGQPDITTDVAKFSRLVNSADVMMAVHGAGLTNMVFLPENAVLIQVIPLGGLEWIARDSFRQPAIDMKLKYMEYRIDANESTLIHEYSRDHPVIKNPFLIHKQGWDALKSIYLDKQNVKPHLGRLMKTFKEALSLLPH